MRSEELLDALKAIAEETRLRVVSLLQHGELTVTDLTEKPDGTWIVHTAKGDIACEAVVNAGYCEEHRVGALCELWAAAEIWRDFSTNPPSADRRGGVA